MQPDQSKHYLTNNQLFWLMQFAGWFGLAVLTLLSITVILDQRGMYLVHPFAQSAIGIVVSWPMRWIFRNSWELSIPVRLLIVAATVMFFSFFWTAIRLDVFIRMTGEDIDYLSLLSVWFYTGVLVFFGWAAIYHGIRYYRLLQDEHNALVLIEQERQAEILKREKAERLAKEAQLKMLRYQLNPHFLFNTMNAITSLINSGRNEEAGGMVKALSEFMRTALQGDPLRRVSLREEIQSLENYLAIEKARFGSRLEVVVEAEEEAMDVRVPGLLLQPLAENVIKHAVRPTSDTVMLSVKVSRGDESLEIEVTDNGPGISGLNDGEMPGDGIGLQNVQERLVNMYGQNYLFRLESRTGGGLRVFIRIPEARESHLNPSVLKDAVHG